MTDAYYRLSLTREGANENGASAPGARFRSWKSCDHRGRSPTLRFWTRAKQILVYDPRSHEELGGALGVLKKAIGCPTT